MIGHPGLVLYGAAAATFLARGRLRWALMLAAPAWTIYTLPGLEPSAGLRAAAMMIEPLRVDALSRLFALAFLLALFLAMLYGLQAEGCESAASLGLAASALGVVFAGDWITLFVCWELMSVFGLLLIWARGSPSSRAAGLRYLFAHALGGGLLFCGIVLRWAGGGGLAVGPLAPAGDGGYWLILAGVAINAAIPPLHNWLTDAYPECSVSASVVQSVFATKAAVYVLLRVFPGAEPLAAVGGAMALYGALFALLEDDFRRLLSYHIVSQVGFMVAGVGLGGALALDGAAAHAFCHILYKALLLMGAGAVIAATGKEKLSELGGLGPEMPSVCALYLVGALAISGFPFLSGFVSKSMTMSSASAGHPLVFLALELASVGTFLSIGLKAGSFVFAGEAKPLSVEKLPWNMNAAMLIGAALCLILGLRPRLLYALLPLRAEFDPYALPKVLAAFELHLGTLAGFALLAGALKAKPGLQLDFDWLYRKPGAALFDALVRGLAEIGHALERSVAWALRTAAPGEYRVDARRQPLGAALFWTAAFVSVLAGWIMRRG